MHRYATAARLSVLEYVAANPPRILLTASWPRAVLQCLFWVLIGGISGAGTEYAFPGAVALSTTLSTVIGLSDVPMVDHRSGTYFRVRLSDLSIFGLHVARALPWLGDAVVAYLLCVGIVGPVLGLGATAAGLLGAFPLFLVMIATSSFAGLAVASFGARFNSNVLLGNSLTYLMLAAGGLVSSGSRLPVLRTIGDGLPLTHGVAAVRELLAGRPWGRELLAEVAVGLGWAVFAAAAYSVQAIRTRRTGRDLGL